MIYQEFIVRAYIDIFEILDKDINLKDLNAAIRLSLVEKVIIFFYESLLNYIKVFSQDLD